MNRRKLETGSSSHLEKEIKQVSELGIKLNKNITVRTSHHASVGKNNNTTSTLLERKGPKSRATKKEPLLTCPCQGAIALETTWYKHLCKGTQNAFSSTLDSTVFLGARYHWQASVWENTHWECGCHNVELVLCGCLP